MLPLKTDLVRVGAVTPVATDSVCANSTCVSGRPKIITFSRGESSFSVARYRGIWADVSLETLLMRGYRALIIFYEVSLEAVISQRTCAQG